MGHPVCALSMPSLSTLCHAPHPLGQLGTLHAWFAIQEICNVAHENTVKRWISVGCQLLNSFEIVSFLCIRNLLSSVHTYKHSTTTTLRKNNRTVQHMHATFNDNLTLGNNSQSNLQHSV